MAPPKLGTSQAGAPPKLGAPSANATMPDLQKLPQRVGIQRKGRATITTRTEGTMLALSIATCLARAGGPAGERINSALPIRRSCSLSPILGALCLSDLEAELGDIGLFIARDMDDWNVLAPTRGTVRRAVRRIRRIVASLGMELAPEKTFVGRVNRGFEFLDYRPWPRGPPGGRGDVPEVRRTCDPAL